MDFIYFNNFLQAIASWISQKLFSELLQNILNWFHFLTTENPADNQGWIQATMQQNTEKCQIYW